MKGINSLTLVCLILAGSFMGLFLSAEHAQGQADPNLVAEWHFDEGLGSVVYDSSGNSNNGNINGAYWLEGINNSALGFDGVDDVVIVPDDPVLRFGTSNFTVEAWIKIFSVPATGGTIIQKGDENQDRFSIRLGSDGKIHADTSEVAITADSVVSNSVMTDYGWHHIAFVRVENSLQYLYVDCALDNTSSHGNRNLDNTNGIYIGDDFQWDVYFNGIIDEIRIWNRTLSSSEIKDHCAQFVPPDSTPDDIDVTLSTGLQYDSANVEYDILASVTKNGQVLPHNPSTTLLIKIYDDEMNNIVNNDSMNVFDADMGIYNYSNTTTGPGVYIIVVYANVSGSYSVGISSFEVVDWIMKISDINATISIMNQTVNDLQNRIADMNATLLNRITNIENNISNQLNGVHTIILFVILVLLLVSIGVNLYAIKKRGQETLPSEEKEETEDEQPPIKGDEELPEPPET